MSFEDVLKQRDQALINMDLVYLRRMFPDAMNDHVLEAAAHKARYEIKRLDPKLRHESGAWLRQHGYRRAYGMELLPEGELPE